MSQTFRVGGLQPVRVEVLAPIKRIDRRLWVHRSNIGRVPLPLMALRGIPVISSKGEPWRNDGAFGEGYPITNRGFDGSD